MRSQINADRPDSPLSQGIVLLQQGRPELALPLLEHAVTQTPQSHEAHNYYGMALARTGHLQEGVAEFRQALSLRPYYVDALLGLGAALNQLGTMPEPSATCKPL